MLVNSAKDNQTAYVLLCILLIINKKRCIPVANHGDVWQKPSQHCNYLPIKFFLKYKFK